MTAEKLQAWPVILAHLMRGGAHGFFWRAEGRTSLWWDVGKPLPIPTTPHNWYYGVHPVTTIPATNSEGKPQDPQFVRSQIAHIAAVNTLFGEFDAVDFGGFDATIIHINGLKPQPTVVVHSGGGYHCLWLLRDPETITDDHRREYLQGVQYRWVNFVGSDGGAKDLARVLRIPGTYNRKPERGPDFPEVRILRVFWNNVYRLTDLTRLLPPSTKTTAAAQAIKKAQQKSSDPEKDDVKLLALAGNAKNGAKFKALWDGDISGYKSHSEADAALCAILAYWTGGDVARIDQLFRLSALYREDKWKSVRCEGATYGAATIARAVAL